MVDCNIFSCFILKLNKIVLRDLIKCNIVCNVRYVYYLYEFIKYQTV